MDSKAFLFLLALNIFCLVCATSRPFSPNHDHVHSGMNESLVAKDINEAKVEENNEATELREMRKIGSSPPSCNHKCYGCMPCEATQVPTTSNRVGVQYTNYEPEGWKCKCGPAFYSP